MCYVALSRVQCLKQLFILERLPVEKVMPWEDALKEKERIDELDRNRNIESLFRICVLNINSLSAHFEDVIADWKMISAAVICLQETWCHPDDQTSAFEIPRKTLHLNSVRKGAGLATHYINKFTHLKDVRAMTYQITAIESLECVVINIYRSQNAPNQSVMDALSSVIKEVTKTIYICGDWNICHRDETNHKILHFLSVNGFEPLLKTPQPTHTGGRCIDMAWIRNPRWEDIRTSISFTYYSDHGITTIDHFR